MLKKTHLLLSLILLTGLLASRYAGASASVSQAGNAYEIIDAVNSLRASQGLAALGQNSALMAAAQSHSDYQASIGSVTHSGPGGSRPGDRAAAAGYSGSVAENIWGGSDATAQQVVNWWTGDAPHWTTMMGANANAVGAGVAVAGGAAYFTLMVGSSAGQAMAQVTPVASQTAPAAGTPAPTVELVNPVFTVTPAADGSIVHEVLFGHTLIDIAQAYGIGLDQLLAQNGLQPDAVIYVGERLIIQPGATATLTPTITETAEATEQPTRTLRPRTPTATRGATATDAPPSATPEPTSALRLPEVRIDRRSAGIVIIAVSAIGLLLVGLTAFRKK